MKRKLSMTLAILLGLGLGTTALAQLRHDDKPHGSAKPAATKAEGAPSPGNRHDEKPHGKPKATQAEAKKAVDAEKK